jgi:hypothetical protein
MAGYGYNPWVSHTHGQYDSTRAMRVDVNYDLEYQGKEVRGLASEALNTSSRPRARLAEAT